MSAESDFLASPFALDDELQLIVAGGSARLSLRDALALAEDLALAGFRCMLAEEAGRFRPAAIGRKGA